MLDGDALPVYNEALARWHASSSNRSHAGSLAALTAGTQHVQCSVTAFQSEDIERVDRAPRLQAPTHFACCIARDTKLALP
jgi:hypothetical protein